MKKNIKYKYRSWRLAGVGEQDVMQVMTLIVFPDLFYFISKSFYKRFAMT